MIRPLGNLQRWIVFIHEAQADAGVFAVPERHSLCWLTEGLALQQLLAEHRQDLLVEQAIDVAGAGIGQKAGSHQGCMKGAVNLAPQAIVTL
jgi:hypothetical protein